MTLPPETRPVHPRARGEHPSDERLTRWGIGSSPRSRGTYFLGYRHRVRHRFIPALAGNMSARTALATAKPVHPRARGEHAQPEWDDASGKRFIPALAGNILLLTNRFI